MSGKQFFHAFEKGILSCPIRQAQINLQHLLVQFLYESRLFHNLTYRRPIEQFPVLCLVIVERLRSKMITQAEKLLAVHIPQGKSEHPMQMVSHVIPPLFISFCEDKVLHILPWQTGPNLKLLAERLPISDMSSVFLNVCHICTSPVLIEIV